MKNVMILVRRKARGNSSYALDAALTELGVNVYRATARVTPLRRPEWADVVVDYGVSEEPVWIDRVRDDAQWFNTCNTVYTSANKVRTFRALDTAGIPQVDSTVDRIVALGWLDEGCKVVSRTRIGACRGKGIVLSPPDPLPEAPLYTKLFTGRNTREYRAYIVNKKVCDITQKRRWGSARLEEAGIDANDPYTKLIRTNGNGWVFARNSIVASDEVLDKVRALAERTAEAIDLGFGAVDLIASSSDGELIDARVVEPNTSVSLVGDRNTRAVMARELAKQIGYDI